MGRFEIKNGVLLKYSGTDAEVVVPNEVRIIGDRAFFNCRSVCEIVLPESLWEICDEAFRDCLSLRKITLPTGLRKIGAFAFFDCPSLLKITIPDLITELLDSTFSGCLNLSEVTLPKCLLSIEKRVFFECGRLRKVNLPEKLSEIYARAFSGCMSLSEITIPKSISYVDDTAFDYCRDNLIVYAPELCAKAIILDARLRRGLAAGYAKMIFCGESFNEESTRKYLSYVKEYRNERFPDRDSTTITELLRRAIVKNSGFKTVAEADAVIESELFANDAEIVTILLSSRTRLGGKSVFDDLEL